MVEFTHNSATHSSTQKSLFSLILGYEPRDYLKIGQTFLPSLEDRLTLLDQARDEALAAHDKSCQKMKEQITSKFTPWKEGDKVWLEGKNLQLHYVTVLFPHRSVLLFFHTQCLLTWRGRRLYTNTAYLFIRTASSFCFLDLSMDLANS